MSTEQILEIPEDAKTPNYDKVTHDVKKLLTATAATYIPELCDALRQDWFPRATDNTFARDENKPVRDEIRERILDDWSNQRNWLDSPWGDDRIRLWFPDWLKHPNHVEANKIGSAASVAARKYSQKLLSERSDFQNLSRNLPEIPKQLSQLQEEEEEEVSYESYKPYEPPEPEMPTPQRVYEDTVTYAEKLWSTLVTTNIHKPKKLIPAQTSDPLIDFIKPSRKVWLRTLKGLSAEDSGHMQMCLVWLNKLIQDRLQQAAELNKERTEIQK
jgi:hypothetical protein